MQTVIRSVVYDSTHMSVHKNQLLQASSANLKQTDTLIIINKCLQGNEHFFVGKRLYITTSDTFNNEKSRNTVFWIMYYTNA